MSQLIDLNVGEKLEIKIDNRNPVELNDLADSLHGIRQQFERFICNETTEDYQASPNLYIKEVRTGSIIIDVVAQALPVVPLLWQGGSLVEWVSYTKSVFEWLNGESAQPPKDITKQDLKQFSNIIEPIAKDNGSQLNFTVTNGGQVTNNFFINSQQANATQNAIRRHLEQIDEPNDHVYTKQVMTWHQTKFDDESQTGNKAIIENISKSPVKVIFENNAVKKALMTGDTRFSKPWQQLAYIVDVKVQTIRNVPKVFTIINYYEEETFDPE